MMALIVLFSCGSISSQSSEQPPLGNKPMHHTKTGFQNHPFVETAVSKGFLFYVRRFWGSVFTPDIPDGHALSSEESALLLNSIEGDKISWLGHASFLLNISGVAILTDPFLTEFASPVSWAGPRRFVGPGITIKNLQQIDVVLVSHSHYDHLDDETIRSLKNKKKIHVVVPLGLKSFFVERGYEMVTDLDWGESVVIERIKITSQPAVHDSARSINDHNQTLWSSWAIESPKRRVLFIGDTGYSKTIYSRIGEKYDSFDYAIVPIGAYEPRKLMWMSHVTPEEAVSIGTDVRANTLIASHWGTVSSLSDEPPFEPPKRFKKAGIDNGFYEQDLWIMKVGETRAFLNEVP
jgi:L-ascorbate metabolism protein UlaG (beta-lactamase superfamily)